MSIFGGQDVELPIITQLMQVETTDADEVKQFEIRCNTLSLIETFPNRYTFAKAEEEAETGFRWEYKPSDYSAQFAQFSARIIPIVETLADTGGVLWRELCDLRKEVPIKPDILTLNLSNGTVQWYLSEYGDNSEPIPMKMFSPSYIAQSPLPKEYLNRHLEELLRKVWRGENILKRCDECASVYVAEKDTARFCSRRCTHRAGERRRYAEKRKTSDT